MSPGERTFALLIRLYPREFRDRYREDLLAFYRQDREHVRYGTGPLRSVRFWAATVRDLTRAAWNYRRLARMETHMTPPKSGPFSRLRWDLRFAWRGLWATRGVTLAALAVLTIGIGASTSIFSVVDAVVLRGLPYPHGDELFLISTSDSGRSAPMMVPEYRDLRARQTSFLEMGASSGSLPYFTVDEPSEAVGTTRITASLLKVLGVAPARGRALEEDDERPGAPPVALISNRLWRRLYNADPNIVGRTVTFKNGAVSAATPATTTLTVVGVMPEGFTYPIRTATFDLWVPFVPTPLQASRGKARNYMLSVVGRLRPGLTLEQASAEMERLRGAIAAENPGWLGAGETFVARKLQDTIVGSSIRAGSSW